jgi:hypothetical protein
LILFSVLYLKNSCFYTVSVTSIALIEEASQDLKNTSKSMR